MRTDCRRGECGYEAPTATRSVRGSSEGGLHRLFVRQSEAQIGCTFENAALTPFSASRSARRIEGGRDTTGRTRCSVRRSRCASASMSPLLLLTRREGRAHLPQSDGSGASAANL